MEKKNWKDRLLENIFPAAIGIATVVGVAVVLKRQNCVTDVYVGDNGLNVEFLQGAVNVYPLK